jgi:hypothetical protein
MLVGFLREYNQKIDEGREDVCVALRLTEGRKSPTIDVAEPAARNEDNKDCLVFRREHLLDSY